MKREAGPHLKGNFLICVKTSEMRGTVDPFSFLRIPVFRTTYSEALVYLFFWCDTVDKGWGF